MFTTYILFAPHYHKFYIGHTADMSYRMLMHNHENPDSYTAKYRPWEIFATLTFDSRSQARRAENYLKKKPRSFIRRLPDDPELRKFIIKKFTDSSVG